MENFPIYYTYLSSPVGKFMVAGTQSELHYTEFTDGPTAHRVQNSWQEEASPLKWATTQFEAYFSGQRTEFDIPLSIQGTAFQQRVWHALLDIPFGETRSYGEIAKKLGDPGASRAVGLANNANPLPVIIPCHRVIGADGKLVGFGGGLPIKSKLLEMELSHPEVAKREMRLL